MQEVKPCHLMLQSPNIITDGMHYHESERREKVKPPFLIVVSLKILIQFKNLGLLCMRNSVVYIEIQPY